MKIATSVLADARVLWDFHRIGAPCGRADVILGLGSYDLSVAEHAARLFLDGLAPWLMFTGGLVPRTDLLQTPWDRAEAKVFGERASRLGVPEERILLETAATNTGENFRFSLELIGRHQLDCRALLVVTKPNMERRAQATASVNVPGHIKVMVTSPPTTFDEYCSTVDPMKLIGLMVGDLQRIMLYPALGFQADEIVPAHVEAAYRRLLEAGFTDHLVAAASSSQVA
jgi:uncharacterized SAM-binding protein YcdF (DUF218 family)